MTDTEFSIKLKRTPVYFLSNELTFSIFRMKSRLPSSVYFILHLFDENGDEIFNEVRSGDTIIRQEPIYTMNKRWIVDNTYSRYNRTFTIPQECVDRSVEYQIELRTDNITSENPLYFNHLMFNEGEFISYHEPNEVVEKANIGLDKSGYANLYNDDEGTYLQVIRPDKKKIRSDVLSKCHCTVLAPHIESEPSVDNPINLFLEFINQTEQRIDVLR